MEVLLEPNCEILVEVYTIGIIINSDSGRKGEFVAIIKNNQNILARIVGLNINSQNENTIMLTKFSLKC